MMKQPADNTNATPADEQKSAARIAPTRDLSQEYAEIEAEAKRLSVERGGDGQCSREEWDRAATIVRNRRTSISKA